MSNQPSSAHLRCERRQSMGQSSAFHLLRYLVYSPLYPALVTPLGQSADLRLSLGSMSLLLVTPWRGLPQQRIHTGERIGSVNYPEID